MHRKKVKLKNYRRNAKKPVFTHSDVTQSSVKTEMCPESKRVYQMKSLIAQCKLCGKKFISEPYLHAHHERRHYGQPYRPQIVDGSAALLEMEVQYLKHRLSAVECQLLKREWQHSFKGKVKVSDNTGDSETESKEKQTVNEHEAKAVETKPLYTDKKSEDTNYKVNKYEKEVEELKNMIFAQIKELKQASQQPVIQVNNESVQTEDTVNIPAVDKMELKQASRQLVVQVNSEFVQTEDTMNVPAVDEMKLKQVVQQPIQPVPVKNECIQTDVVTVDVQEKEDGELHSKLEERESVWRLRLAKADEQHKQELKQIQDRLQQTYEEGNKVKRELEEKLKKTLLKLAAIEKENTQLSQKQPRLEEKVISDSIKPSVNKDTDLDGQIEVTLIKNKISLLKIDPVETIRNNKLLEIDVESSYEKENEIVTVEKDKEDESDFEISLPNGFKHKQNIYNTKNISNPIVGNFCEDKFETVKENKKSIEQQMKSPVKDDIRNKSNMSNIMEFLSETEENLIKTPVKKLNFMDITRGNTVRKDISDNVLESDEDMDEDDDGDEDEEAENKEKGGMFEDMSESGSSYSGSSESEEDSITNVKPDHQVVEIKQPIQRTVQEKAVVASSDDLQYLINEMYLQTLENMQQCLIVQPDMLNNVQQDVEEKLQHRLKQLAIDPDWTSLPQATFQSKMALLKHHQNIAAKSKVGYFTQRGQLARDVDMMKRNPKDSGNCKVMQGNVLNKLKTKIADIVKAYPKLANRANYVPKSLVETSSYMVTHPVYSAQQNSTKIVSSSPKHQTPIVVKDELLRKELEEIKTLQQSANKLKMYALDEELSESDSLSWSLSSISKDMSPGKGTSFHVENKMKSAMKNAAASSVSFAKKRVLFAE